MNNLTAKTIATVKFLIVYTLACAFVASGAGEASAQRRSSKSRAGQSGKQSTARQSTLITAARLDLLTGEIQTKNLDIEPQGPVILGRTVRGVFQPSNYVEFPNLAREPNPKWSRGWIDLKTGKIHSDVEAVKPREPFLRGRIAPDNRFYVDSKELENLTAGFYSFYPNYTVKPTLKLIRRGLQPKIVPQFLPESWTITDNDEDSIEITSLDNQAIVTINKNADFSETDALRFAKGTEKQTLRSFNAYRQLSLEPAPAFGDGQGYVRRFQWRDKEIAEDIILIQVYYVENGYEFTATAAARASNFEKFKPQLQRILDNLRIEYKEVKD